MQKFMQLSSLNAFDPLPSLGKRVQVAPKAAPVGLAPVPGKPGLWRGPGGLLAYLPPLPNTPRKPGALPALAHPYGTARHPHGARIIPKDIEEKWFESWVNKVLPPGDVEAVEMQWKRSETYRYLLDVWERPVHRSPVTKEEADVAYLRYLKLRDAAENGPTKPKLSSDQWGPLTLLPKGVYMVNTVSVDAAAGAAGQTFARFWDPDGPSLSYALNGLGRTDESRYIVTQARSKLSEATLARGRIVSAHPIGKHARVYDVLREARLI